MICGSILVLVIIAVTQSCIVELDDSNILKPKDSIEKGAQYLSHQNTDSKDLCYQGCCNVSDCDTSFYTGMKLDRNGNNCFYFNCSGTCVFEFSAKNGAGNFSVAQKQQLVTLPESNHDASAKNKNSSEVLDYSATNGGISTTLDQIILFNNITNNITKELSSEADLTVVSQNDTASNSEDEENASVVNDEPSSNKTVADPEKDSEIEDSTVTDPPSKESTGVDDVNDDRAPVIQPQGEKDDMKNSSPVNKTYTPDSEKSSDMIKTNVKVDISIHDGDSDQDNKYTVKGVVFWVSVVGGAGLIIFGLAMVVRVYRNKRRRLYSSLTDDYLINGMYSI